MTLKTSERLKNVLDRIFRPWRAPIRPVRAYREGDAIYIDDGARTLRILDESRLRKYRRGIDERIKDLAAQYGLPKYAKVSPGDTVLNIGANIGELCLWLTDAGARTIAVEPDDFTLACFAENLEGRSVTVVQSAVWESDTELFFNIDPANANGSFVNASDTGTMLKARTVDSIVADLGLSHLHLLVGDVEGAEPEMLRGATRTLAITDVVSLDCGYERNGERTLEPCAEILKAAGFRILRYQTSKRCNLVAGRPGALGRR